MNALPGLNVTWDESAQSLDTFLRYNIYRRESGDTGDGTRIKTITDRSRTEYFDASAQAATAFEYNVTVTAEVGGEEVEGELATWAASEVDFYTVFVHSHQHPEIYGEFLAQSQQVAIEQDISEVQVYRRAAPTSHIGPRRQGVVSIGWRNTWVSGSVEWAAVEALLDAQQAGDILVCRQHRDIRLFGFLHAPQRSDGTFVFDAGLTFRANHFTEAV